MNKEFLSPPENLPIKENGQDKKTEEIINKAIDKWGRPNENDVKFFNELNEQNKQMLESYPESDLKKVFLYSMETADLIRKNPDFLQNLKEKIQA